MAKKETVEKVNDVEEEKVVNKIQTDAKTEVVYEVKKGKMNLVSLDIKDIVAYKTSCDFVIDFYTNLYCANDGNYNNYVSDTTMNEYKNKTKIFSEKKEELIKEMERRLMTL